MSHTSTVETRDQAFRRLLQIARESGVKLKIDSHGDYWATSTSEPGRLYPVTPESCGCQGFQRARRCRHVAALRSHLGFFDPEPGDDGPTDADLDRDDAMVEAWMTERQAAPSCRQCDGRGYWIKAKQIGRGQFIRDDIICPHCHGTGHQVAA